MSVYRRKKRKGKGADVVRDKKTSPAKSLRGSPILIHPKEGGTRVTSAKIRGRRKKRKPLRISKDSRNFHEF